MPSLSAIVWALASFAVWCSAWQRAQFAAEQTAWLTVLALLAGLVSLGIRRPRQWGTTAEKPCSLLTERNRANADREWTWACATIGNVYLLGWIAMLSPSLLAAVPALLVVLTLETLAWPWAPLSFQQFAQQLMSNLPALAEPLPEASPRSLTVSERGALTEPTECTAQIDRPSTSAEPARVWQRQTTLFGEDGMPGWLEGSVRFHFEPQQRVQAITIGFSPAFHTPPCVELETEVDATDQTDVAQTQAAAYNACEAQLEQLTPAGMRIIIKRSATSGTQALDTATGWLMWHAAESFEPGAASLNSHEFQRSQDPGPLP